MTRSNIQHLRIDIFPFGWMGRQLGSFIPRGIPQRSGQMVDRSLISLYCLHGYSHPTNFEVFCFKEIICPPHHVVATPNTIIIFEIEFTNVFKLYRSRPPDRRHATWAQWTVFQVASFRASNVRRAGRNVPEISPRKDKRSQDSVLRLEIPFSPSLTATHLGRETPPV